MTDKAKILAEIDRLRKNLPWGGSAAQLSFECNCKNEAYTEIEKFINSLPEEHVSPCVECASISEGCKEICYDYNKWVRDNHKEEPVSKDLEEAAIEIYSKILKGETVVIDGYEYVVLSDAEECFKVGAKWQKTKDEEEKVLTYKHGFEDCKEQLMTKAVETTFDVSLPSGLYDKLFWIKGCKDWDKLLIIKKDEL